MATGQDATGWRVAKSCGGNMSMAVSQLPAPLSIALSGLHVRSAVVVARDGYGPARQGGVDPLPGSSRGPGDGWAEAETRPAARRETPPWRAGTKPGPGGAGGQSGTGRREAGQNKVAETVRASRYGTPRKRRSSQTPSARNPVGTWAKDREGDVRYVRCHDSVQGIRLNAGACERDTRRTKARPQDPGKSVANGGKCNPAP